MNKLFFTTVLWIIFLGFMMGFALPYLISAKDTSMVIIGATLIVAVIYIIIRKITKILGNV